MVKHGHFCWNELMTHEPEKAMDFYGKTLGWTFEKWSAGEVSDEQAEFADMDYWMIKSGDDFVGGVFPMTGEEMKQVPEHWFSHVEVDDVDQRVAGALAAGGQLMRPIFDIPGIGRVGLVIGTGGARMGWITGSSA